MAPDDRRPSSPHGGRRRAVSDALSGVEPYYAVLAAALILQRAHQVDEVSHRARRVRLHESRCERLGADQPRPRLADRSWLSDGGFFRHPHRREAGRRFVLSPFVTTGATGATLQPVLPIASRLGFPPPPGAFAVPQMARTSARKGLFEGAFVPRQRLWDKLR